MFVSIEFQYHEIDHVHEKCFFKSDSLILIVQLINVQIEVVPDNFVLKTLVERRNL